MQEVNLMDLTDTELRAVRGDHYQDCVNAQHVINFANANIQAINAELDRRATAEADGLPSDPGEDATTKE